MKNDKMNKVMNDMNKANDMGKNAYDMGKVLDDRQDMMDEAMMQVTGGNQAIDPATGEPIVN